MRKRVIVVTLFVYILSVCMSVSLSVHFKIRPWIESEKTVPFERTSDHTHSITDGKV